MSKWNQGEYKLINPQKYIGTKAPIYKSAWERSFMALCDKHPNVVQWAYESIQIPYRNPLKLTQSIYIPDFLIVYEDKNGRQHAELVEVKPISQTLSERAKTRNDRLAVALNHEKWKAAEKWCKRFGIKFRIMTEEQLYGKTK